MTAPRHPTRATLEFSLLLLVWWGANNVYAVDAHLLFRRFPAALLYVDLTVVQILVGLMLCMVSVCMPHVVSARGDHGAAAAAAQEPQTTVATYIALAVAVTHFLATMLTNASYSLIGATSTLLWKLAEPLAAVVFKRILLRESTPGTAVLGVLTTLSGVLLFSRASFEAAKFSPIILANLLFPARNVLLKLAQRYRAPPSDIPHRQARHPPSTSITTTNPSSSASSSSSSSETRDRFFRMLRACVPLAVFVFIGKLFLVGSHLAAAPYLFRNALLFNAYQLASFALLERLDALTHSLLNTIKRFTGILLSMLIIRSPMVAHHYEGLSLTVVGFVVYLIGGKHPTTKFNNQTVVVAMIVAFVSVFFMGASVSNVAMLQTSSSASDALPSLTMPTNKTSVSAHPKLFDPTISASSDSLTQRVVLPLPPKSPSTSYIVHLANNYQERRRSVKYSDYKSALADDGGNVGNLVWQYGARVALPDFSNVTLCTDEPEDCATLPQLKRNDTKLLQYRPLANIMNPSAKHRLTSTTAALLSHLDEIVIVGMGVQVEFRPNSSDPIFDSSASIQLTADDYDIPPATKGFLDIMTERKGQMLLRGDFTERVTRRSGFKHSYSVGCPSFWINEDVQLGRSLEARYRALESRVGDRSLKVAVNLKSVAGFFGILVRLGKRYPNARFYAQGPADLRLLMKAEISFDRVRFFTNVEDWLRDLKEMDVAIGVRIHGNMIALGAGLPVFVIASDHRVLEMVQRMRLPHATTYDETFASYDLDVAQLATRQRFDGARFDRNRCEIANIYKDVFARYGIGVRPHVQRVAEMC